LIGGGKKGGELDMGEGMRKGGFFMKKKGEGVRKAAHAKGTEV